MASHAMDLDPRLRRSPGQPPVVSNVIVNGSKISKWFKDSMLFGGKQCK